MNTKVIPPKCPQCGSAIPADAPQGLCPRCVLLGAATPTDSGRPRMRTEPPALETLQAAFPQLEIVGLIGRGGMGFVYKARQPKLDRAVALKLLPMELGADPHFAERFNREARALARLNHPNIVAVYDFGVSGGFGYLLMEFVDGVNLRQAMQAGRFSPAEALAVVPKICEALQFAHEQGVLHRDIKPENILLDGQGRVKIADFGIAKLVGDDQPDLSLTVSGAHLGTPSYMAPEQIEKPSDVDHRADIYSLGVVFYELLTGELPLGRFAPPSSKATLDARVDDIVMRALAKERELRQQSAGEVKSQVETVTSSPGASSAKPQVRPPTASPSAFAWLFRSPWRWGVGVLLLVAMPGLFVTIRAQRQAAAAQEARAVAAAVAASRSAAVPLLTFTFVAVEIRDDPAGPWLALDYSLATQGDCQPTFRSQRIGVDLPVNTRMSSYQKDVAGRMVEHRRVEWQLPATMPAPGRLLARDVVSMRWLHKSVSLRPGDEEQMFVTPTPEGTLIGWIGCRFVDAEPDTTGSGKTVSTATNTAAGLELEIARRRLSEVRKQVAAGVIAAGGLQALDAELAVALAEATVKGDPLAAARARLAHAESLLPLATTRHQSGLVTQAEVETAELKVAKAREELKNLQSGQFSPKSSARGGTVQFFGEVNAQVELRTDRPTLLTEAILSLGIINNQSANLRKVKVLRADGTSVVVDVKKIVSENQRELDMELRDGDRVEVPTRIVF
jgi:tRNA A-37 threonylcarbamoyl transferase component Bud32